tara:strand:+ start:106 stop:852 length:747 start_codon:yes stop_codon:yes gene_type:complete
MVKNIYILKLQENKYFVGKTDNIEYIYHKHLNGTFSEWTKKYKPVLILEIIEDILNDEDAYVIKYMNKYGIENVRGGSYNDEELSEEVIKNLNNKLKNEITINDYIQHFYDSDLVKLNSEIEYLKKKYNTVKAISDKISERQKLIGDILTCEFADIYKHNTNITKYYNKYCKNDIYIDILVIQYYEIIFEYYETYNIFNKMLNKYKKNIIEFNCDEYNISIETIDLHILLRQLAAIMKLKLSLMNIGK